MKNSSSQATKPGLSSTELTSSLDGLSGRAGGESWPAKLWRLILVASIIALILFPAVYYSLNSRIFLVKLFIIAALAFFPGWLYLLFIKNLRSIYDEYVLNLFRLHVDDPQYLPQPPVVSEYYYTWAEASLRVKPEAKGASDNIYRRKFEDIYGRVNLNDSIRSTGRWLSRSGSRRRNAETFSPVLFLTALLCIGWSLVIRPAAFKAVDLLNGIPITGLPQLPYRPLMFGFLGAYAFILQDLIRRYFRNDLKTAAYLSAAARVVFVVLIVSVASLLPAGSSGGLLEAIAFFIGLFPQAGLQFIKASLNKRAASAIPTINPRFPLSRLDGLNVWYETRLLEEGIEDMQNLVTANIVDLMLQSRIPVSRLVDWMDQAFLCMRVEKPVLSDDAKGNRTESGVRTKLRSMGIRTATDLERAWESLQDDAAFCNAISQAMGVNKASGPAVVRAMLKTLEGELNLRYVRQFKRYEWLERV